MGLMLSGVIHRPAQRFAAWLSTLVARRPRYFRLSSENQTRRAWRHPRCFSPQE